MAKPKTFKTPNGLMQHVWESYRAKGHDERECDRRAVNEVLLNLGIQDICPGQDIRAALNKVKATSLGIKHMKTINACLRFIDPPPFRALRSSHIEGGSIKPL